MKFALWILWILVTLCVGGFYAYNVFLDDDKDELLIGDASHGHFQIELDCGACHTEAFGGQEILQDACINCHAEELEIAQDSHPRVKFSDPRNAALLEVIDARYCISCHTEHQEEQTNPMGLTMPKDYCFHCHENIAEERPSHEGLGFETCASAGCHNYHDNRALYETFLARNGNQPWLNEVARITSSNNAQLNAVPTEPHHGVAFSDKAAQHPEVLADWSASAHAEAGVNCGGCHSDSSENWVESPSYEVCATCHDYETETFMQGKHGMRLAAGLDPLDPVHSQMAFSDGAAAHNGCNSCHAPHDYDREFAATDACLGCHADDHSLAFKASPHGMIAENALLSGLDVEPNSIVTCATCHMPSISERETDAETALGIDVANINSNAGDLADIEIFHINHNQNDNLRPNEKMIRPVCMQCHGLGFSIDALADPLLIENNFNGQPSEHIPSIEWSIENQSR